MDPFCNQAIYLIWSYKKLRKNMFLHTTSFGKR